MATGEAPAGRRVDHHRGVDVVEAAGTQQRDLAAAAFLRGSADRRDRPLDVRDDLADGDRRGRADHRDEVVPAAVSEFCERVVLGEDRDARTAVLPGGVAAIRGFDAAVATLHLEAVLLQEVGETSGGLTFLVCGLGIRVDRA